MGDNGRLCDGIYRHSVQLAFYEGGDDGKMRVSSLMRRMEQVGAFHLDAVGYDQTQKRKEGTVILLSRFSILFTAPIPVPGELTLETWARGPKGALHYRDYAAFCAEVPVAVGKSAWVFTDTQTHRPFRPPDMGFLLRPDREAGIGDPPRLVPPPEGYSVGQRTVRRSDIDANHHMNNAVYADIFFDYARRLPAISEPWRFDIVFKKEARLGDLLLLSEFRGENYLTMTGNCGDETMFIARAAWGSACRGD